MESRPCACAVEQYRRTVSRNLKRMRKQWIPGSLFPPPTEGVPISRNGTDRNSTLKHGTDQASKKPTEDISPLLLREFSYIVSACPLEAGINILCMVRRSTRRKGICLENYTVSYCLISKPSIGKVQSGTSTVFVRTCNIKYRK